MNIKTASLSNSGGRSINDDTVRIWEHDGNLFAFVGDGLGGYAGGQQASQTAAEALINASRRGSLLLEEQLGKAADAANQAVCRLQQTSQGKMKTTIVFLTIEDGRAKWMHVGDSRLYHFRNGHLVTQTMDHSVSQVAVLMGEITPRQIRFHEDRNRVLRALGGDNAKPDVSSTVMLTRGQEAFLLCTDGFWEYVYEEEMEQLLQKNREPEKWLTEMEKLIRERAPENNDNYTAAAVFYE